MAITGTIIDTINLTKTNPIDLVTGQSPLSLSLQTTFTDGVGLNQINRIWSDSRTLGTSANESHDLAGSALIDEFGTVVVFVRVKFLYVRNTSAIAIIGFGNNVANFWSTLLTDEVILPPGGRALIIAPDAAGAVVTAGTGDLLNVANKDASNGATYDIVIGGGAS